MFSATKTVELSLVDGVAMSSPLCPALTNIFVRLYKYLLQIPLQLF